MLGSLQQRFEQPGVRLFARDRLVMLELSNACGTTVISTMGATVLSYAPAGGEEVIWVSDTARYDGSKAVRGGIPVCWPWFGPHPSDPSRPAHGFVRHATWELVAVDSGEQSSRAVFRLESSKDSQEHWPWAFRLELVVTLADTLTLELRATNLSDQDWTISEALHTYFRVADARGLLVEGLDGLSYWDKQQGGVRGIQASPLRIDPPIDRVFFDHQAPTVIHDRGRDIHVGKTGSRTSVVWNPGPTGAASLNDMPDTDWPHMVCVETANALDERYSLAAGETHSLGTEIALTPR